MNDATSSESTSEPLTLSVRGLSRDYEGTRALEPLDLDLAPGRILGLVGPNGAGKTTALRMIAGILPTTAGSVAILGHDVEAEPVAAKRHLGWVPDDPTPFDSLTVWEHLEFTARLFEVDAWPSRAEVLLRLFELVEKRDALGGELSRGMRQKLSFACAWLPEPALLLLDEPLSGLDPRGIRAAREAIRGWAQRGTSVILSSHLLDLVEVLADEILVLDRGRKVFHGTLAEARALRSGGLEEIFFAITGDVEATNEESA
ncbi:MAG: ABC transporter ATP-binding protein [Planctomycetota bacterium]